MITRATDLNPTISIDKISPLIPIANIGNQNENLKNRLDKTISNQNSERYSKIPIKTELPESAKAEITQFIPGQTYAAKVLEKVDKQVSLVSINNTIVKMALGNEINSGQSIALKYVSSAPAPTFLLTQSAPTPNLNITNISPSAQLIQYYLKPEQKNSGATHIEAQQPITSSPTNAIPILAQDLQRAITQTGLFYESHIASNIEGKHHIADLMQEPQNQNPKMAQQIVTQQLNLLDNQKLVWHGEVWPQQTMQWEIERKQQNIESDAHHKSIEKEEESIHSKISLQLPKLGNISAELHLHHGKMRIQLITDDLKTSGTLKANTTTLIEAIESTGQSLQQLTVAHHDT